LEGRRADKKIIKKKNQAKNKVGRHRPNFTGGGEKEGAGGRNECEKEWVVKKPSGKKTPPGTTKDWSTGRGNDTGFPKKKKITSIRFKCLGNGGARWRKRGMQDKKVGSLYSVRSQKGETPSRCEKITPFT